MTLPEEADSKRRSEWNLAKFEEAVNYVLAVGQI
jgi:hypothetical protein